MASVNGKSRNRACPASGLRIAEPMLNAVVAHLAAARPNEGVGLIAVRPDGELDRAVAFYPGTNLDQSPTRYTMDPTEVLAALGEMGASGWTLGAIVHSHVQSAPTPSATDVREAYYPEALMLIVGFTGNGALVKLWRVPKCESEPGMREVRLVVDNDEFSTTAGFVVGERSFGSGKGGRDKDCKLYPTAYARTILMADRLTVPQPAPGSELVPVLASFPDELGRMLQGYSVEALKRPASDGGWGVIENLGHLRDWEEIYQGRVQAILAEDDPVLPEFDDQLWEIEHDYRGQEPLKVLDQFRSLRQQLAEVLDALAPEAWSRRGRLGAETDVTVTKLVTRMRDHDAEHARAIADALA